MSEHFMQDLPHHLDEIDRQDRWDRILQDLSGSLPEDFEFIEDVWEWAGRKVLSDDRLNQDRDAREYVWMELIELARFRVRP